MNTRMIRTACLALSLLPLSAVAGDDEDVAHVELDSTTIRASRELPSVMAVVPWKSALPASLGGRPAHSLVENLLEPLDPEVLRLQLEFYEQLFLKEAADEEAAVADTTGE